MILAGCDYQFLVDELDGAESVIIPRDRNYAFKIHHARDIFGALFWRRFFTCAWIGGQGGILRHFLGRQTKAAKERERGVVTGSWSGRKTCTPVVALDKSTEA